MFKKREAVLVVFIGVLSAFVPPFLAKPALSTGQASSATTPETGFLSPEKYVSAFFGFSLSLPKDPSFSPFKMTTKSSAAHFLFGVQSRKNGQTMFFCSANQLSDSPSGDPRKSASGPKGRWTVGRVAISGAEFWEGESQEKVPGGKAYEVTYAAALNGYVVAFNIVSSDPKLAEDLKQCVESLTFSGSAKPSP
jgi:hypothetical protein